MKKKKLLIILFPILLFGLSIQALGQSVYYYGPQGKTNFTLSSEKVFVKFAPSLSANDRQKVAGQFQRESNLRSVKTISEQAFIPLNSSLVRLETNQKVDLIRTNPGVKWASPVLVSRDGEEIAIGQKVCVKLKSPNDVMSLYLLASQYENALVRQDEFLPLIYYIELPQESALDILNIANQLAESKTCVWAEPVFYMTLTSHSSDDPGYPSQWHLNNTGSNNYNKISGKTDADIDAPEAWTITTGSPSIKIAIIDDGVDLNHPDLKANILPGYDASGRNSGGAPEPNNSHGTSCAGIVAAVGNNKIGGTGIAPNCKIIPVRIGIVDSENRILADNEQFTRAINWAWKDGKADVLSNSWGGGEFTNNMQEAVSAAVKNGRGGKGCPVFFSSGNFNRELSDQAAFPLSIAVGAVNMCDERKRASRNQGEISDDRVKKDDIGVSCDGYVGWGSNFGVGLDVSAPSPDIVTTAVGNNYTLFDGTSASCPVAAGVMALILSANPNLTEKDARFVLESTCDKAGTYTYAKNIAQPNGTWCPDLGYGRVNAHQAVLKARTYVGQADDYELSLYAALEVSPNPSNIGQDITVRFNLANTGNKEFSGTVAVALFTENGDFIEFMKTYTVTALPVNNHYVNDRIFNYPNQKPKRRFKIGVFYAPTGVQDWTPISPGRFENFITWLNGYALNSNCALPPLIKIASTGYAHFSMSWQEVPGIQSYEIRYRRQGVVGWIELPNWSGTTHVSSNKTPCTTYEWQIRSVCASSVGDWSPVQLIKTEGCGDPYCYSYGISNRSFIKEVNIGSLKVSSSTDYGYANRTNSVITTSAGAALPIKLTPGQNSEESLKEVYWKIWIDYNGDKIFDELVFEKKGDNESSVSGTINIPNCVSGKTRLRVMMSLEEGVDPCDRTANKEVEDYGIDFGASVSCKAPSNPRLLAKDYSWFQVLWDTLPGVQQYSWRFKQLGTTEWATDDNWRFNGLTFSGIKPCTEYQLQVRTVCGNTFSDWSPELRFKTDGCNETYCFSYGISYNDWIKEVNFAGIKNTSSSNFGYTNFTTKTPAQVELGKSYPLALSAGFNDNSNGDTYYWNVWIDFNQDNDFNDSGELVFNNSVSKQTSSSGLQGQINIPTNAKTGKTRMRVALSLKNNETPCETSTNNREVEDYLVEVSASAQTLVVAPSLLSFSEIAGNKNITITSNASWLVTDDAAWLSITPSSGNGNGTLSVNATANTGTIERRAQITVRSTTGSLLQNISVIQAVKPFNAELPESWEVPITENNHTLILPSSLQADIEGSSLQIGDHVGVFYTRDGKSFCAGEGEWNGSNTSFPIYGDDASTTVKDGLSTGEVFVVKVWQAATQQEFNAQATYAPLGTNGIISATDRYTTDAISMITRLSAARTEILNITLKEGWNTISSYVLPTHPQLDSVFKPIKGIVQIAKDGAGKTYITTPPINSIGSWKIVEGYRIKVTTASTLPIFGKLVDPAQTAISIRSGWQIIPFFSRNPKTVEHAFSSIKDKIEIVKDNTGKVYLPDLSINTIGQLQATQGYRLKAKSAGELRYPSDFVNFDSNDPWAKSLAIETDTLQHFRLSVDFNTGSNATLVVLNTAAAGLVQAGDEIGVFAADSILCGAGKYTGENLALTVWGDDATETGRQGLFSGEPYQLRIWNKTLNRESNVDADFGNNKGLYQEDDVVLIQALKLKVTSPVTELFLSNSIVLFPNPSTGSVNVLTRFPITGPVSIRVLNSNGQVVAQKNHPQGLQKGMLEQFDLTQYPSGFYQIQVLSEKGWWNGKLSVVR